MPTAPFPRHAKGLLAARNVYIQSVRQGMGPTDLVAAVIDAYVLTQREWKPGGSCGKDKRRPAHVIFQALEPDVQAYVRTAAETSGLTVEAILGDVRIRGGNNSSMPEVAYARQRIWTKLRAHGLSYPKIGRMFDRDHTTIMWSVKKNARIR